MKTRIIRLSIACSLAASAIGFTSCETTGDPTQGGIFWSENKAQDRLYERQDRLERAEAGTNAANRSSAQTQRQIDALQMIRTAPAWHTWLVSLLSDAA